MAITPNTEVRLLSVPFSNDYKHTMDFGSKSEQTSFMMSKTSFSFDEGFTYQRQDHALKVPVGIDDIDIMSCNYVMYQNSNYGTKWWYAFITSKRYVNPNTTELTLQTDVFQTWQFDMQLKPSFIERQHCKRWNSDGSPVINTVDEGLNYGTEYDIVDTEQVRPQNGLYFLVIGAKNTLHDVAQVVPKKVGIIQPLSYYFVPFRADTGATPTCNLGTIGTVESVLQKIYSDTTAVNNVVSLSITEYIGFDTGFNGSGITLDGSKFQLKPIGGVNAVYCYDMSTFAQVTKSVGNKYDGYKTVTESKLLMYPYTSLTLTDLKGSEVTIKNEYINSQTLSLVTKGSIGTHNKTAHYIDNYNQTNSTVANDQTAMQYAIINDNPNDVPIISDLLSAYLQGNKNTLALKKKQIEYNQSNDVANGVIASASIKGFESGGTNIAHGIQNYVNHEFEQARIMAKQKDIANVPPSISNMGGNTGFDYGNGLNGIFLIKRQIKDEYLNRLSDYFKMYGYKYQRVETPNYKSRSAFNYIKTVGIIIQGNIPNDDLAKLKAIFDNGVTIWHTENVGSYFVSNNEV